MSSSWHAECEAGVSSSADTSRRSSAADPVAWADSAGSSGSSRPAGEGAAGHSPAAFPPNNAKRDAFVGYPRAVVVHSEMRTEPGFAGLHEYVAYAMRVMDGAGEWSVTRRWGQLSMICY
jgi:hypothetical protein